MSQDSENLLNEEKIKLAKEATKKGKPVEEIADISEGIFHLDLPGSTERKPQLHR